VTGNDVMRTTVRRTSFLNAVGRVFDLSLSEMLWSRRTVFMLIVLGAPVFLALVSRIVDTWWRAPFSVNGERVGGAAMFGLLIWWVYLRFVVPVLGVFYGTALIADEVEDKTITYLFTRPVPRSAILFGKYVAYLVCTTLVVLPSVTLVYFLLVPAREIGGNFVAFVTDLGLLALGLAVYGALFALVGTTLQRPVIAGLVFAFGWEQIAMLMPGYVRRFTLVYYLQGLVPHAIPSEGITSLLAYAFNDSPAAVICLSALGIALIVTLVLAMRVVERREYVLSQ
jgi:ABC-type transport system involved in multi-copper enzyme maturation permease subunit